MRLREPRATALIFASGKMCVTGVKSTHNATLAAKKFAYIVERVGFEPQKYVSRMLDASTADEYVPRQSIVSHSHSLSR